MNTEDVDIKRFEDFLTKVLSQESGETTNRLVNRLKDSIQDMKQMQIAREASVKWLAENSAK